MTFFLLYNESENERQIVYNTANISHQYSKFTNEYFNFKRLKHFNIWKELGSLAPNIFKVFIQVFQVQLYKKKKNQRQKLTGKMTKILPKPINKQKLQRKINSRDY